MLQFLPYQKLLFYTFSTSSQIHIKNKLHCTTDVSPKRSKQQRKTPLLFQTGRSPQVIFFSALKQINEAQLTLNNCTFAEIRCGLRSQPSSHVLYLLTEEDFDKQSCSLKQVHKFHFKRRFRKPTD